MGSAIREKTVGEAERNPIADIVAVALVLVLVVEGLGVGQADLRAFTARDHQPRICGGKSLAVKKQVDVAAGGHGDGRAGENAESGGNCSRGLGPAGGG